MVPIQKHREANLTLPQKVQTSMYNNYFSNFGRPPVPNDLCKDSAPRHPQFWRRRFLIFHSPNLNLSKIGSAASEEKSFENVNGWTDGRMDNRREVITIAHPEHSSGELMFQNDFPRLLF